MKPEVVQIAKLGSGGIVLCGKAFAKVLDEAKIGERKVAVISICGEYGKGKSFLAKLFLKYLEYTKHKDKEEVDVWLDRVGEDSMQTDEPGIYLYRQIFKVDNVAILIMQVQGSFSVNRNFTSQLFLLAGVLSSVQILNFRTQLQGVDLSFMKDFTEELSALGPEVHITGKWDQELQILIRDWPYARDMEFGFKGGMKYFDQALRSEQFETELMFTNSSIKQLFRTVRCFLMPHPGLGIRDKKAVEIDDLGMNFVEEVQELARELLSKTTVQPKKLRGVKLSGKLLLDHAENCVKEIKKYEKKMAKKNRVRPNPHPRNAVRKPPKAMPRKNYLKPDPISKHGPVKVIDIKGDDVTLNAEEFERILGQEEIGDKPIAIISIAGAFRKGKSFILNFFLRYMRNKGYQGCGDDWMGDLDKSIADGFVWSGGIERHTSGIVVYSEPFIVKTPKGEVAVLFMDTQGLFDKQTTEEQNLRIFAFNTLISSVQILNVSMNLDESVLTFLQYYIAYAKHLTEDDNRECLQSLKFLIRDWQNAGDFSYGSEGGGAYLEDYLETSGRSAELRAVRQYISSAFHNIGCFLMPHPGFELQNRGYNDTTLKDIREEFRKQLTPLVSSVLHPDNLEVKIFHGKPMTAQALYATATRCIEAFNDEDFKMEMNSVLEIITDARMDEIRHDLLEHYSRKMAEATTGCSNAEDLKVKHAEAKKSVFKKKYDLRPYEKAEKLENVKKHADQEMESCFTRFVAKYEYTKAKAALEDSKDIQDALAAYREKMNALRDEPVAPEEFDEFYEKCWRDAELSLGKVGADSPTFLKNVDGERTKVYEVYKEENRNKFELLMDRLEMPGSIRKYTSDTSLDSGVGMEPLLPDQRQSLNTAVKDLVKQHQEKINEQNNGSMNVGRTGRRTSETLYDSAREMFDDSGRHGNFKNYIKMVEEKIADLSINETTKIEPDKGRLQSMRLRKLVNDVVHQFDKDTIKFRGLYAGQVSFTSAVEEMSKSAIERFDQKSKNEEAGDVTKRHRGDLLSQLKAKKDLLHEENTRNQEHYNLARKQMQAKAVKRYHDRMDQLLKSGYIAEGRLKKCHAEVCSDVLADMNPDDLPIYVEEGVIRSDDINFVTLKKNVEKKLDGFYEKKKQWNKKNHGIIVRALANFMYKDKE